MLLLVFSPLAVGARALLTGNISHEQAQGLAQIAEIVNPAGHGPTPQLGKVPANATPGQFNTETFVNAQGQQMTYYLYVPAGYTPSTSAHYPVILILHGNGERGSSTATAAQNRDVVLKQNYVLNFTAPNTQKQWPSFVVVPQIGNSSDRWVNVPGNQGMYTLQPQPTAALQTAIDIVASVEFTYHAIDGNRAYLTGISMGAYGVWDAIERWPTLFAAAAPLSGAGDPNHVHDLKHLPIWSFHGSADGNVPVSGSRQMFAALSAEGAKACYTEFAGQDHGIWNTIQVYAQPQFQSWLFAQTRAPAHGQTPPTCAGRVIAAAAAR